VKTLIVGASGHTNPGVAAPPIVDITNGTTFVVSADDATSAVLVEALTTSMTQLAKARIGIGAAGGTALNIFEPAFDNNYFNNPSTGQVRVCGTGSGADTSPYLYEFGFTGITLQSTPLVAPISLSPTLTVTSRCTPMAEFYNPNVAGGTDFFFFGLTSDCTGAGGPGGCVMSVTENNTITRATITGGPSGIVIDNYSTDVGASSIYLSARNVNTAYKFTQNGLQ
jgi:hypothetical protein